jgi:methylthioribose-1-phosphate isomerase
MRLPGLLFSSSLWRFRRERRSPEEVPMVVRPIEWMDGKIKLIDQSLLPGEVVYRMVETPEELAEWIKGLKVRGAPLIGVAAAFGCVLGALSSSATNYEDLQRHMDGVIALLASTRPTAVNLFWALERMRKLLYSHSQAELSQIKKLLQEEALQLQKEDEMRCKRIGENGARVIADGMRVLTHCNAGTLATSYWGTALGVLYSAREQGKNMEVWVTETRPLLQGARLTCWELRQAGLDPILITDNSAGWVIKKEKIDCILVGADRIALNGDVANKIGTYSLSILAKEHGIPLYVAAPTSTIDRSIESGEEIIIEERSYDEVVDFRGHRTAPEGTKAMNYAFDVTPSTHVSAIITEVAVFEPPYREKLLESVG